MAKIAAGAIYVFHTGDLVDADVAPSGGALNPIFETIRVALNDTDTRVDNVYTKTEIDTTLAGITAGVMPDNSVTNTKLATDVKVGSLAALTTTDKSSVVAAMIEVRALAVAAVPLTGGSMTGNLSVVKTIATMTLKSLGTDAGSGLTGIEYRDSTNALHWAIRSTVYPGLGPTLLEFVNNAGTTVASLDQSGHMTVVTPSAAGHATPKSYVDTAVSDHTAITAAPVHGSTSSATANKLAHRDVNGRTQFADPSADQDAATKKYVDSRKMDVSNPVPWAAAGIPTAGYWGNTQYTIGVGNYSYTIIGNDSYEMNKRYDPLTNTFTTLAAPSVAANYAVLGLVSDGTYIYAIALTGQDSSNLKIYKYDIAGNTWSTLTDVALPNTDGAWTSRCYPVISGSNILFAYKRDSVNNAYYVKVDKSTGSATFLLETGSTVDGVSGTFISGGNFYVIRQNGGVLRVNIATFTGPGTYSSTASNGFEINYTPSGNSYSINNNVGGSHAIIRTFKTTTADNSNLDRQYIYLFDRVESSSSVFIPGLGRLVHYDGSYQSMSDLIGY